MVVYGSPLTLHYAGLYIGDKHWKSFVKRVRVSHHLGPWTVR